MKQNISVLSKKEIANAVTDSLFKGEFNYFEGDIRNGNRYARVSYCHLNNNKLYIQVTYWEDGKDIAVEYASHCSSARGLTNKVAKFLNLA